MKRDVVTSRARPGLFGKPLVACVFFSLLAVQASEADAALFTSLTLQNGWTNAPSSTRAAAVSQVSGIVHLAGAIGNGTTGVAFTLPAGLRPATNVYVPVDMCAATKGRLFIEPSGVVTVQAESAFSNAQCFTSLDGVSFALSTSGFTNLTLQNGWTNAPFATSVAAVMLEQPFNMNGIVHFKGAIAGGTTGVAFTLPVGFRPTTNVYVPVDLCSATNGRLVIQPSGVVTVEAEGGTFGNAQCFTSLDGAWFSLNSSSLPLQNGWTAAPFGTSVAAVSDIGGIFYFKGAIASGTSAPALTLPTGFRPATNVYVPVDLCSATKGRLLIQPSGAVTVQAEGGTFSNAQCFTSLDGVSFANSTSATTDIFNPHYPVNELHSLQGAKKAGSFAASAMMGAQGFSGVTIPGSWDSTITSSCAAKTPPATWPWPASCNPAGMAQAVNAFVPPPGASWVTDTWPESDETDALNTTILALSHYQSPAVVPIFGQADHWVAITQINATSSGSSWTINQVKMLDGGPPGSSDSGFNAYQPGLLAYGGGVWSNIYFKVLTAINTGCDPNCNTDPYFGKYVLTFDPPRGQPRPPMSAVFAKAPGVVPAHRSAMNEHVAQTQVWKALAAAGIDADPEIWGAIRDGVPGPAFEVNGLFPSGKPWPYYLVPLLSHPGSTTAIAFVQLAVDDGSFEGIHVLTNPVQFAPLPVAHAEAMARRTLAKGESLTGGVLTWDPRSNARISRSPVLPYYEFGIVNAAGADGGVVRVALHDGQVERK